MAKGSPYLRNCWYVIAVTDELANRESLSRTIMGEPILLFKDQDGTWSALADSCPHRFAPLSRGSCTDGVITCAYHGLSFNASGKCIRNPHGPISGALSVKSYPVRAHGPLIWIWMGDAVDVDPSRIARYDWTEDNSHHLGMGYIHGAAHYELMTDNILDLSHIEFLHPLLGSEAVSLAKVDVTTVDDRVITTRHIRSEELSGPLAATYRTGGAKVDRELRVEWQPPSLMELTVTVRPLVPQGSEPRGSHTLHLFTPETENSTHYFFVSGMDREATTPDVAAGFRAALEAVFLNEDKPMIDAQQRRIGIGTDIMDRRPALLSIDRAPALARRCLQRLIEEECGVRRDASAHESSGVR